MRRTLMLLILVAAVIATATTAQALTVERSHASGTSGGRNAAGAVCDFLLREKSHSSYDYLRFTDRDGHTVRQIFHLRETVVYTNAETGYFLTAVGRYSAMSIGGSREITETGAFLQLRDPEGKMVRTSSGLARIRDQWDLYTIFKRTPNADEVPGFAGIFDLCELLGGHAA